jgi:2,4-dienoyl-CoA reductase (NADPH2)
MEVKNRIVMAGGGTGNHGPEGEIKDHLIDYYVERARGGVGLIITQSSIIMREALVPGRPSMYDDKFIPMLRKLSDAVHEHGSKVAFQIVHHGKLLTQHRKSAPNPDEIRPIAPSAIPRLRTTIATPSEVGDEPVMWVKDNDPPLEATKEDIARIIEAFANAARRVRDAGFDAVEIHGAHGYLISQFLSPLDNRRNDEYGGSTEKRARFACEVIEAVREKVGPDFPIIFRFSGSDFMEGGITIEESVRQAPLFVEAGADALHISASQQATIHWQYPSYLFPKGVLVPLTEAIKRAVPVPVIAVGKLGDPRFAEKVLRAGKADFIAMARPLMADPELPNKAREGRFDDICYCVNCLNCFNFGPHISYILNWGIPCTVNPAKLREREFTIEQTPSPKEIMVVGGGLAGMEASRTLAQRGHRVTLYEKSERLGGQWYIACQQNQKREDYPKLLDYMQRSLEKTNVTVRLNTEVNEKLVKEVKPDAVVVATGAAPRKLEIAGADGVNVVQAVDVILGSATVGKRVLVVGGRHVGMEIADDLADRGKIVYLVTRSSLGRGLEKNLYLGLRDRLVEKGVYIFQNAPVVEIMKDGAFIAFNEDLMFLKANTVVMATGMESEDQLVESLKGLVSEIYAIGDCVEPRDAMSAIHEGAEIGRNI